MCSFREKHPIESTLTEGILRIPLVSKALIENEISRLSFKDEVTEIYIAGVQLLVKAYFREGINSPIELLITDGRIISNVQDSVLGILTGNLIYQKLKFTVNTNFAISRADEHIDQSIIVYHKLGGIQMLRGAKTISITAIIGLVFTNEHKIYNRS